jgi:4-amino-4-deoxy-L-arabinose transferase-like glycosyltransferase
MPRKSGLLPIVLAVVVRILLAGAVLATRGEEGFHVTDTPSYRVPAQSLVEHSRFDSVRGGAEIFRTPGYPLLLTAGVWMGSFTAVAIALNVLASASIVALTLQLAGTVLDERRARWCAIAAGLEPTLLLWTMKVMPETLLTLCLLFFVIAAIARRPVLAAVALCAAAYLKPVAYPFIAIAFAAALAAGWRRRALVFLATSIALVAPWQMRNHAVARYSGFSTIVDEAVYFAAGGAVSARKEQVSYVEMRERLRARVDAAPPGERASLMRREGAAVLASAPAQWAIVHLGGLARTMFEPGAIEYLRLFGRYPEAGGALMGVADRGLVAAGMDLARRYPAVVWLSLVFAVFLTPLMLLPFGAWRRTPEAARPTLLLVALLTAWMLFAGGGVHGNSRFRVPVVPFLIVMSALALHSAHDVPRRRRPAGGSRRDREPVRDLAADRPGATGGFEGGAG